MFARVFVANSLNGFGLALGDRAHATRPARFLIVQSRWRTLADRPHGAAFTRSQAALTAIVDGRLYSRGGVVTAVCS